MRAVAPAQRQTGLAISTHTTHFGELPSNNCCFSTKKGYILTASLSASWETGGADMLLPVARTGAWLEIDNIGWLSYTSDEQRGRNICELAEAGYLHRILLGTDIALNSQLSHYGAKGYG